ncbi:hypothetical protein N9164_07295 [Draconibacterium sp.]|nr:hypothetical protein [Draconibacterium sp.]
MKFLEYLYVKYYSFQVRVGNSDVAPFSSMLVIAFTFMLYYLSIFFLGTLFIPKGAIDMNIFKYVSIFLFFFLIIWFYLILVHKGKYKSILKKYKKELTGRKRLVAILFPLIAFLLFNLGWILKMLQNQGRF